jgi:outer membrane receptor protein involved in Fe transport
LRSGLPEIDLLDGSPAGSRGRRPRHGLELQAGLFIRGLGARLTANWQSATFVRGASATGRRAASDLFFSDLATVGLRLFANLDEAGLGSGSGWMKGARLTVAAENLFDARPRVRDRTGATPLGYQPAYLDSVGRSIRITFRKLF